MISKIINYFSYNSIVILSFFFISFLVLIINSITKGKLNRLLSVPTKSIINPFNYIRLITRAFCHLNWSHFRNNFVMILLIGPMLESRYGSIRLLIMILITTLITSIINVVIHKSICIGASDSAYMLIILASIVNIVDGKIPLTLVLIFLFYIVEEIYKLITKDKDDVSHDGHLIGALMGLIFGYFKIL